MFHHFDHRWATHERGDFRDVTLDEKAEPAQVVLPRYWVAEAEVHQRINRSAGWLLAFRDITNSTNERTAIFSAIPAFGANNKAPLLLTQLPRHRLLDLYSNFTSFVLDFVARQSVGGTSLSFFILKQLPVLPPETYAQPCPWANPQYPIPNPLSAWLLPRVVELTYTAWDLAAFAQDVLPALPPDHPYAQLITHNSQLPPPFRWDEERRFLLRCELDAAFFHLYAIQRDDVAYILDTFPIVKRKDEAAHGEYRTARVILEIYDEMARSMRGGRAYHTRLHPPPADPGVCHPERGEL